MHRLNVGRSAAFFIVAREFADILPNGAARLTFRNFLRVRVDSYSVILRLWVTVCDVPVIGMSR